MSIADILAPAPNRSMSPAVFIETADAFVASLLPFAEALDEYSTAFALSISSTSTTSLTNNTSGNKTLTIESGKGFVAGMLISVAYTTSPTIQMIGTVVSYDSTTGVLVFTPTSSAGASGPYTAWTVGLAANLALLDLKADKANASLTTVVAKGNSGTGTVTFDIAAGGVQTITFTGNHTWAFTWPAGYSEIEIIATNAGAYTLTTPSINWIRGDGTKSTTFSSMDVTLQSSGVNHFIIWSPDGGTTRYGRAA